MFCRARGTLSHVRDPRYPGVCEEIINVGDFWKTDSLTAHRTEICDYTDRIAELYNIAYRYLSAANEIDILLKRTFSSAVNYEKLTSAAGRLAKGFKNGTGFTLRTRLLDSLCGKNSASFDTFADLSERRYFIQDDFNTAHILLRELICAARIKCQPVMVSYSPLNTSFENAIYLPGLSCAFVSAPGTAVVGENDKIINMERFVDTDILRGFRQKIRFGRRCFASLMDGARDSFDEIKSLHDKLEEIYIASMDFKKKEDFTKKLLIKIFKPTSLL